MMIIHDAAYDKNKPCVLFDNMLTKGTLTATNGIGENAVSGTTWDFWTPSSLGRLSVDLYVKSTVDCLFIDAHNISDVGGYVVWSYFDGTDWVNIEVVEPTDNSPIMVITDEIFATQFRVSVTGSSLGVVMMGKRLVFPNGIDSSYRSIPHSKTYTLLGGDSDAGQFTGQMLIRQGASVSPTFPLLDADWVDSDMKPFEDHYNRGLPFAWAASPAFNGDDMGFCQRPQGASELNPSYYEGGMYEEFTMHLGVYINE